MKYKRILLKLSGEALMMWDTGIEVDYLEMSSDEMLTRIRAVFQLNWNTIPAKMEQGSRLAGTRWELKKLTTRAYRVRRERWRLEVGRVS